MLLKKKILSEEHYRFGADGNLRLYSYDRLFFALYGYNAANTRTYKYSFDLNPNWVNGRLENVSFNLHNAMFYPNSYLNFNSNGYYTKHYYNGMERIASRLGDRNISINVSDPDLQDRKDWQDSLIRKNVTEITGYQFLEPGQEQDPDDPKPVFELPQVGLTNLIPNTSSVYYYHPNHLGSTCYVTDGNASVVQGFLYAPFGEITNEYNSGWQNGVLPKYSFNAKELDEETGMYYYEARYMAPPVFISRDPLFEKYPTFTPYAYCANNPIKYVDPTGEEIVVKTETATYYWYKGSVYVDKKHTRKVNAGSTYMYNNNRMLYNINFRLNDIYDKREGKIVLNALCDSKQDYNISNDKGPTRNPSYSFEDNTIRLNGHSELSILSHELFHAFQDENNREPHTIYNEVEAYVFMGMITGDYSHSPFQSDKRDYQEAGERMIKGKFSTKDFNILLSRFRRDAKANQNGTYSNYKYNPGKYTPGQSLLKKFQR